MVISSNFLVVAFLGEKEPINQIMNASFAITTRDSKSKCALTSQYCSRFHPCRMHFCMFEMTIIFLRAQQKLLSPVGKVVVPSWICAFLLIKIQQLELSNLLSIIKNYLFKKMFPMKYSRSQVDSPFCHKEHIITPKSSLRWECTCISTPYV